MINKTAALALSLSVLLASCQSAASSQTGMPYGGTAQFGGQGVNMMTMQGPGAATGIRSASVEINPEWKTIYGKIKSIAGNEITLQLAEASPQGGAAATPGGGVRGGAQAAEQGSAVETTGTLESAEKPDAVSTGGDAIPRDAATAALQEAEKTDGEKPDAEGGAEDDGSQGHNQAAGGEAPVGGASGGRPQGNAPGGTGSRGAGMGGPEGSIQAEGAGRQAFSGGEAAQAFGSGAAGAAPGMTSGAGMGGSRQFSVSSLSFGEELLSVLVPVKAPVTSLAGSSSDYNSLSKGNVVRLYYELREDGSYFVKAVNILQ